MEGTVDRCLAEIESIEHEIEGLRQRQASLRQRAEEARAAEARLRDSWREPMSVQQVQRMLRVTGYGLPSHD